MKKLLISATLGLTLVQSAMAICPEWNATRVGQLDRRALDEASGLTTSKLKKGMFIWSNDSGGQSALFATDASGKLQKSVQLSGFRNEDYEALEAGPCPNNAADSCLYVGDIGDGMGWRSTFKIGIFKESDFWSKSSISPIKVIDFKYPGGANNAEAMVVTADAEVLIFTKTEGSSQIFAINSTSGKIVKVAQLDLTKHIGQARGKDARLTDASISSDGDKVLLLTYGDIMEISLKAVTGISSRNWKKGVDYNIIRGPGLPQQETISYVNDNSFIVSTESPDGDSPAIYSYTCKGF